MRLRRTKSTTSSLSPRREWGGDTCLVEESGDTGDDLEHSGDVPLIPGGLRPWQRHDLRACALRTVPAGGPLAYLRWEDVVYRTTYDKTNGRFLEHLRPTGDILQYRDDQAPLVGQRWKKRKEEGKAHDLVLPHGPVYLITTFWFRDPARRHALAPIQLPTFQIDGRFHSLASAPGSAEAAEVPGSI